MKFHVLFATILFASSAFAQEAFLAWPMPSPLPAAPAGVNSAAYPTPRIEWLQRFNENLKNSRPIASNIELIFDGDSITDAWQGPGKPVWTQRYKNLHAFDFGIAGDRTETVLWRLSQGQMNGIHPKLIVLMIGTNNLGANSAEQIAEGVKAIIADYQKLCPEATILLQAIFPREENPDHPWRAKIKAINQLISQLGDGKKVIYIDFSDKFLKPDGTLSREIMPDFLHPSTRGYQIWADAIQPTVNQFFP